MNKKIKKTNHTIKLFSKILCIRIKEVYNKNKNLEAIMRIEK